MAFKISNELRDCIGRLMYPVGSLYLSTHTTNPSTLFGGTWLRVTGPSKSLALLASKYIDDAGEISDPGHWNSSSTVITTTQTPAHTHTQNAHFHWVTSRMSSTGTDNGSGFQITNRNGGTGVNNYWVEIGGTNNAGYQSNQSVGALKTTATNNNTGGSQGHTHTVVPPYYKVNVWRRTV